MRSRRNVEHVMDLDTLVNRFPGPESSVSQCEICKSEEAFWGVLIRSSHVSRF